MTTSEFLEQVWDGILSRDKEKIVKAYASLDDQSQATVISHLHRMTTEPGWHSEQVKSAQAALDVLAKR